MAAPTISTMKKGAQPLRSMRKSLSRKKKSMKNILHEPYRLRCPVVSTSDEQEITNKLKVVFDSLIEVKKLSRRPLENNSDKGCRTGQEKQLKCEQTEKDYIREQLVIGINAVTRALEHGQVRLLLVDRDSQPPLLTRHLIGLSALHGCPAIWISKLTKVLGPRLDVTSLVTLAFKKRGAGEDEAFDSLVALASEKAPENKLPWVEAISETEPEQGVTSDPVLTSESKTKSVSSQKNSGKQKDCGNVTKGSTPSVAMDYSSLYILKSESRLKNGKILKKSFSDQGFLSFCADSASEEDEASRNSSQSKRFHKIKQGKVTKKAKGGKRYFTAKVSSMVNNEERGFTKETKTKGEKKK